YRISQLARRSPSALRSDDIIGRHRWRSIHKPVELGLCRSANTLPVGLQVLNPRLVFVPILNFVEFVGEYHALREPDRLRPVLAAFGGDVQGVSDSGCRYRD